MGFSSGLSGSLLSMVITTCSVELTSAGLKPRCLVLAHPVCFSIPFSYLETEGSHYKRCSRFKYQEI